MEESIRVPARPHDSAAPPVKRRPRHALPKVLNPGDHADTPGPIHRSLAGSFRGSGKKRPILLMGHTDVVGVERDKWTVDPFGAVVKDGYLYGRGASDDKDNVAVYLEVFLLLHRLRVPLDRDVIFLAQAGEEGNASVGMGFLVAQHWDKIACQFALDESGFRSNVIPATAEAFLDVRVLPDEDVDAMVAALRRLIDDPAVEVVGPKGGRPRSRPSSLQTDMFRALQRAQRVGSAAVGLPHPRIANRRLHTRGPL